MLKNFLYRRLKYVVYNIIPYILLTIINIVKEFINLFVLKPNLYFNEICAFLANEYNVYVSTETVKRHL